MVIPCLDSAARPGHAWRAGSGATTAARFWRGVVGAIAVTVSLAEPVLADVEVFRELVPSVVRIQTQREAGGTGMGTGVVVGTGLVATNCHVTRDATAMFVLRGQERWRVKAQHAQPQRDVCVLRVPGLPVPAVEMAPSASVREGDAVMAIGYSLGIGAQFTDGRVVGRHALDGGAVIQSDAPFTSGASGGGLFDGQGRLVGVLTFRLPVRGPYYFSLPSEWLAAAMTEEAQFVPVGPLPGARSFWEAPAAQWPYFLRATSLEAAGKWSDLLELTGLWLESEPENDDAKRYQERARKAAQ